MKPASSAPSLDGDRYRALRDAIAATRAPATPTSLRVLSALVVAAVFAIAAALAASELVYQQQAAGLRLAVGSTDRLINAAAALMALTSLCTWAALSRGAHGLGRGAAWLAFCAALAPAAYAALTLPAPVHSHPAAALADISPWGLRCIALALLVGGAALASFTIALRRAAPAAARLRGAALGAAAGAWAGLAVFVFCPSGDALHLLIGHSLPVLAFTVAGALVCTRFLRP